MTEKELHRLGRGDLLRLLLEQSRENQSLREELQAARDALADKTLCIDRAGSIAEASLQRGRRLSEAFPEYPEKITGVRITEMIGDLRDVHHTGTEQIRREVKLGVVDISRDARMAVPPEEPQKITFRHVEMLRESGECQRLCDVLAYISGHVPRVRRPVWRPRGSSCSASAAI